MATTIQKRTLVKRLPSLAGGAGRRVVPERDGGRCGGRGTFSTTRSLSELHLVFYATLRCLKCR